jgi:hypothetical protein
MQSSPASCCHYSCGPSLLTDEGVPVPSNCAYEASNHYYYTPLDLVEKTLNCRYVMRELDLRMKPSSRPMVGTNRRSL